jgi:hypothetical protein
VRAAKNCWPAGTSAGGQDDEDAAASASIGPAGEATGEEPVATGGRLPMVPDPVAPDGELALAFDSGVRAPLGADDGSYRR